MACFRVIYFLLLLLLLLLLQTLTVRSIVQNVTRSNDGDTFSNPDNNCQADSCVQRSSSTSQRCKCKCNFGYTFVVHNDTCVENQKLLSNLLPSLPGKDASLRLTMGDLKSCDYAVKVLPTIDIMMVSKGTLCLVGTVGTNYKVIKKDSSYFYDGKWYPIWPEDRKQNTFNITKDKDYSYLQWTSLGKQFTGLIFRLSISCQLKGSSIDTYQSNLLFKSTGSQYFNGNRPTLAPISPALTSYSTTKSSFTASPSTASPSQSGKGKDTSSPVDKGLIAGLTIFAILVIIVIVVVVIFFLRKKRSDETPSSGARSQANPTYEQGPDRSIHLNTNGQTPTYDYPDTSSGYQPLVQNTRMRDASGKPPVYTPLNRETKGDKQPVVQLITPDKRGLAYETVAVPIQQPLEDNPEREESHVYEDPTNPTIPNEGGLYAVSAAQDGNNIDFENTAYSDPESVIRVE